MSLILDALRKSEHERQRQVGPGLAVVPEGQASRRPAPWVLVLGGLLALNMLVLGALLVTDRRSTPVSSAPVSSTPASPARSEPARAAPAAAPPQERLRVAPVQLPATAPRSDVRPLTTEVAAATPAAAPRTAPAAGSAPDAARPAEAPALTADRATQDARLPRFADLLIRGELNVPHMHLDIHVHSDSATERFVFINMRRYNEGDATQEGPRIERITRDGVVMEHQGQRFFLSRD